MWPQLLCWFGVAGNRTDKKRKGWRGPGRQRRGRCPLVLETLECRTLLSAPGIVSQSFTGSAGQFDNSSPSGQAFLGGSFNNVGGSAGGIDTEYVPFVGHESFGAQVSLNMSGKAGLDVGYSASAGKVNASYPSIQLAQNYVEPTQFGQEVTFSPQNTFVSYPKGGSFATTAPSFNAYANLDAQLSGSLSGAVAFFSETSNTTNFNASLDQNLFSVGINGNTPQVSVLGQDVSPLLNQLVSNNSISVQENISEVPPIYVSGTLSGSTQPLSLTQDMSLGAGYVTSAVSENGNGDEAPQGSMDLGSVDEYAPSIALSSTAIGSDGSLSADGQSKLADLNIQMGPLVSSLLGLPGAAGIIADTDTVSLGSASVSFTPISFQMGPDLSLVQTGTVQPVSTLTYAFTNSQGNTMFVDVTKDGADLGPVTQVSFTPGVDTIALRFANGQPITVTPTWTFGLNYTNEIDLQAGLEGTLTVGQVTGSIDHVGSLTLGPIYQQTFDLANYNLATVYSNTFSLGSQSWSLHSFTVGNTFKPSLAVTTTADTGKSGSLRFAVASADALGGTQVIQLGPGNYALTIAQNGHYDGSSGALNVTDVNLTIVGAGANQTTIHALDGDRVLLVGFYGNLTLEDVTIEGGTASAARYGGGIYGFFSSSLDIDNSVITGNQADQGGGVYTAGNLTVTDSTIAGNSALGTTSEAVGGGIAAFGTTTISSSTIAGNTAGASNLGTFGAGIYNAGTMLINDSTISGNEAEFLYAFAQGGGIFNASTQANSLVLNNTIVAGNLLAAPQTSSADDIQGSVSSASADNLIGAASNMQGIGNGSNGNLIGTPNAPINARLSSLSSYGGPTPTVLPLPGSPAIAAGADTVNTPAVDQRGYPRLTNGHVDIGAAQYQYDLELTGGLQSMVQLLNGVAFHDAFTLTNNGPDAAYNVTLSIPLPANTVLISAMAPAGWTETGAASGQTGTVRFTNTRAFGAGNGPASFVIAVQQSQAAPNTTAVTSAIVTPSISDIHPAAGESSSLTIFNELEGQHFHNVNVFHFTDPNPQETAADFKASVAWNDGTTGTSHDGSVTVVSDPAGGFDVLGSHTYATAGLYAITVEVVGQDNTHLRATLPQEQFVVQDAPLTVAAFTPPVQVAVNQPINNALLLHFSDANPAASATQCDAQITWGDGTSSWVSSTPSAAGQIVPDPTGGFDVLGSHTYTQTLSSGRFAVAVLDVGGASIGVTDNSFQVLANDQPLTPGPLTVPAVTTAGQSISNMVLFQFSDPDTKATASDYLATVSWGDGTFSSSDDGSGSVTVAADPTGGGFDVIGSHVYGVGSRSFAVKVTDLGDPHATPADLGGQITGGVSAQPLTLVSGIGAVSGPPSTPVLISEAPLELVAQNIQGSEGISTGTTTVATFTDLGGPGAVSEYAATIGWGDGTVSPGTIVANADGTFSVQAAYTYAEEGTYPLNVTVTHGTGDSASATGSAEINVVLPTAGISGPNLGVPGQPRTFTFTATNPSPVDQAVGFSYTISWGDGTPVQTVPASRGNGAGMELDHTYTAPGSYTVSVMASNADGGTGPAASMTVSVKTAQMEGNSLAIGGGLSNHSISVSPADTKGSVNVRVDNASLGTFKPTDHIFVYGQANNETIALVSNRIAGKPYYISVPAFIYGGGTGLDVITASGSTANNVLIGGAGRNQLDGGQGRDLLIAGLGRSTLMAGSGGDILVGGSAAYGLTSTSITDDEKVAALEAIMAEWGSADSYATRINDLTKGGGSNGASMLNVQAVHGTNQRNGLAGQSRALDWFFADTLDTISRYKAGEVVTTIS